MNKKRLEGETLKKYEKRVVVIKAMAHPTRLFILELLNNNPLCVCDINELIDADISTISKHLSLLKSAGLVSSKKSGLQVIYTLEKPCVLKPFSCLGGN